MVAVKSLSGGSRKWDEDEQGNLVEVKEKPKEKPKKRASQALIHVNAEGSEYHYSKR